MFWMENFQKWVNFRNNEKFYFFHLKSWWNQPLFVISFFSRNQSKTPLFSSFLFIWYLFLRLILSKTHTTKLHEATILHFWRNNYQMNKISENRSVFKNSSNDYKKSPYFVPNLRDWNVKVVQSAFLSFTIHAQQDLYQNYSQAISQPQNS